MPASVYAGRVKAARGFIARLIGAVRLLARDERIPKPMRWVAGVALLPIPGPVDEVVLVLVAPLFATLYRESMRDAWRQVKPLDKPSR
jgi:hypothetical protein